MPRAVRRHNIPYIYTRRVALLVSLSTAVVEDCGGIELKNGVIGTGNTF